MQVFDMECMRHLSVKYFVLLAFFPFLALDLLSRYMA